MHKEISRGRPNFMVEFEAEVQEILGVSRNVGRNWGFRTIRTDLQDVGQRTKRLRMTRGLIP